MENFPLHPFRKPKKLKNGKIHVWYYYYINNAGKKIQRRCTGCKNRSEAESFVRSIPRPTDVAEPFSLPAAPDIYIKDIAGSMFVPGSAHLARRKQLGKSIELETILINRNFINIIIETWGDRRLESLEAAEVSNFLFQKERSGSWKNSFIQILNEVFEEAAWYKIKAPKLPLPTFARHSKKADIFTTAELNEIFKLENFPSFALYAFFLVSLSGGLRLGEARAIREKQIILEKKALIVDGFCKKDGRRTVYNKAGTVDEPKLRVVFLPAKTVDVLKEHIEINGAGPEDFVFTTNSGRPFRAEYVERVFYNVLQKVGLIPIPKKAAPRKKGEGPKKESRKKEKPLDGRKLVPHSLRYTYISRMRREVSAETLLKMTGHNSVEMVDYYTRPVLDNFLLSLPGVEQATENLFI
jgi:integrase